MRSWESPSLGAGCLCGLVADGVDWPRPRSQQIHFEDTVSPALAPNLETIGQARDSDDLQFRALWQQGNLSVPVSVELNGHELLFEPVHPVRRDGLASLLRREKDSRRPNG